MIEGVLRHCTEMAVGPALRRQPWPKRGGLCLLPPAGLPAPARLKRIHAQRLYRPEAGKPDAYPRLQPVLSRPIDWELIRQQYDQMVKYATALRLGTAEAEEILRRFTRDNVQHPTYKALVELGKAMQARLSLPLLAHRELRREIHEGLNVVENWNGANDFILFGRGGEIGSNRLEDQEVSMLALHLLQNCMVYVNTLMLQRVLAEPTWLERMGANERRALTPLFWGHVNPYGTFQLDMTARLPLDRL